jgi:hypothetical protein
MGDEPAPKPSRRLPVWETVAIFAALGSLWPAYVLRWPSPWWRVLGVVMLVLMVVVFVRRTLALKRLAREAEEERRKASESGTQGRARLPWEP